MLEEERSWGLLHFPFMSLLVFAGFIHFTLSCSKQGHLVCRYLFVRCDNEPAPWTRWVSSIECFASALSHFIFHLLTTFSDEHGDLPRPLPDIPELKEAKDVTERKGKPSWDYIKVCFYYNH